MVGDAFVDCVGGLLSVVGQNLQLSVEGVDGVALLDVATTYPKAKGKNGAVTVTIRDIQSEETRDLICHVKLPADGKPSSGRPVLRARLAYDNCVTNEADAVECVATLDRPAEGDAALKQAKPSLAVDEQKNRTACANALDSSSKLADKGKLPEARGVLQKAIAALEASPTAKYDSVIGLVESMNHALTGLVEQRTWETRGRKMNANISTGYHQQRANPMSEQLGMRGYSNFKKSKMKKAMRKS
jgi:hypothetical protein